MSELIALAPLGIILLTALIYFERLEGGAALRLWRWGFFALFAGALLVIPANRPSSAALAFASIAFVALMYAGARAFAEKPIPRWLLPATATVGGARAVATLMGRAEWVSVFAILFTLFLFGAAARLLWINAKSTNAGQAEQFLGPALMLLGVLHATSMGLRLVGIQGGAVFALMVSAATAVALIQILAGFERARDREKVGHQALEQERQTLRAVIETAPLDILVLDHQGRVRMMNQRAAGHLELLLDAFGEPLPDQPVPDDFATLFRAQPEIGDRLRAEPDAVIERKHVSLSRSDDRTLEVFSSPVRAESEEPLGRLWIVGDVTREVRLQHQLVQSQKMETLGTLAGGVAHDFNNHLTTILGNAQLARAELTEDQDVARDCLDDLDRAAKHCSGLTQGLLAFARRAPASTEPVDVEPLLEEVEGLLRATLPSRIQLEVDFGHGLGAPRADATQLKQVLVNLAINARDAIEGSGTIRLTAQDIELDEPRPVINGHAEPGRYVSFDVTDTGTGIDPRSIERIFDPFFTTKPTGEGTGLGLAIVYGVVSSSGGFIDVESRKGDTTVSVAFPSAAKREVEGSEEDALACRGHGETILVADDEPAVRRLVRSHLEALGYAVIEAESGEHAAEMASAPDCKIDLAVLDLSMPGIDGLETLRTLRESRPGLPGLIVSGYLDEAAEQRMGSDDVLHKPFDQDSLARAVRQALARVADAGQRST